MGDALKAGTRIGGYRIVRLLGEGGVGTVHEAVHDGLEKRVAIKMLHADALASPDAVQRFVREGKIAAKIRHPNVVDVTDVGVDGGTPYLVMELLDGLSLSDHVEGQGPLPLEAVLELALPIVDALAAAHDEGVVHRDLKPDNVFLVRTRSGELHPKLLDFGISKVESVDARLTSTTTMMGTPYYMSPEQARGAKNVDARSDQFSFGLVLYEMATGKRPIDGDSLLEVIHKISSADIPSLGTVRPDLPPEMLDVVARLLAVAPDGRFASMREVGAALLPFAGAHARALWERAFSGVTVTPPRASLPGRAVPTAFASTVAAGAATPLTVTVTSSVDGGPRRRTPLIVAAAVVALVGAVVLGASVGPVWTSSSTSVGATTVAAPEPPASTPPPTPTPATVDAPAPPPTPTPITVDAPAPPPTPTPTTVDAPDPPAPPAPDHRAHHVAARPPPAPLPTTLSPEDVTRVLSPFAHTVAACNNGPHGVARVALVIEGRTGRISAFNVTGPFTGTAVQNCIAGTLHTAHFPRFAAASHAVMFPYRI